MLKQVATFFLSALALTAPAQSFKWYQATEQNNWEVKRAKAAAKALYDQPVGQVDAQGVPFVAWGTTFNELDGEALGKLTAEEQDEVFQRLFAPDGDLRLTRGRLTMNANDYSMGWYACDTVAGDFGLRYFNIERDKQTVLPMIHHAQKYQPDLRLWMSPWSPPAWMKINQDYPVLSSPYNRQPKEKDYLLYGGDAAVNPDEMKLQEERNGYFPKRMATQNYMIQDPRYLQAYANMFGKFIDLYKAEGAPIDMVMYQNEAYSYTPYPGCAWTAEGTVRFNKDYLIPTLAKTHPQVRVYIGTFNTNRLDYVEKILGGLPQMAGIGLQWEGRQNIGKIRAQYPQMHYIVSESECGNGSMDWQAAEHTFFLLCDNIGNGCDQYYNWNFILQDNGVSRWGWKQNALIQVDSKTGKYRYTPEYYAFKLFSHFVSPGTRMVGYNKTGVGERWQTKDIYVVLFRKQDGRHIVCCANFADGAHSFSVPVGKKFLNITIPAHSLNTFAE